MASRFDDVTITGNLTIGESAISPQLRANILKQDALKAFPVLLTDLRVWDALHTNLPGTAATDDLALIGTVMGSAAPTVSAGDLKAAGATTRYARTQIPIPECYDAAETLQIVVYAGMVTTIADTSCTVDVECYRLGKLNDIGSDICATSATTMNSTTFAAKTFTITATTLSAGDILDVRFAITCTDAATGTAVKPTIAAIDLVCDIRG